MTERKMKKKRQTMVDKRLHRKLKIAMQHNPDWKKGVNSGSPEGLAVLLYINEYFLLNIDITAG